MSEKTTSTQEEDVSSTLEEAILFHTYTSLIPLALTDDGTYSSQKHKALFCKLLADYQSIEFANEPSEPEKLT